jgi:hypothetical protein
MNGGNSVGGNSRKSLLHRSNFSRQTLNAPSISEYKETTNIHLMRTILLSSLGAILLLAVFGGCSTTVRTDNGHAVTTGVHTR